MSFQNTFRNTNGSSSSTAREYFINYNNIGTGFTPITNVINFIWGTSSKEADSPSLINTFSTKTHSYSPNLESLGGSCICTSSNSKFKN
jgi:hypothetical protein